MRLPGQPPAFAWDSCPGTKHGLHAWIERMSMFYDSKHVLVRCSSCRASGTFTYLELARWAALVDERLSPQRRGTGGRK